MPLTVPGLERLCRDRVPSLYDSVMNTYSTKHHDGPRSLTDDELQRLEALLGALDSDDAMVMSELDGYCAALACCPEPIAREEWLPDILGGAAARQRASDPKHAAVLDLIERHRRAVIGMLEHDQGYAPVWMIDAQGRPEGAVWALGFVRGMALRPDVWDVDDEDEALSEALDAVLNLAQAAASDAGGTDEWPWAAMPEDEREARMHQMIDGVKDLYEFFRAARTRAGAPVTVRRAHPQPGRNQPCRCGSGRKFKQCCGAAAGS